MGVAVGSGVYVAVGVSVSVGKEVAVGSGVFVVGAGIYASVTFVADWPQAGRMRLAPKRSMESMEAACILRLNLRGLPVE